MPLNVGELQATMDLDISRFTRNMNSAKDQLRGIGVTVEDNVDITEEYSDSMSEAGSAANGMDGKIRSANTSIKNQSTETKNATEKNKEYKTSINEVKDAWGKLKGALGALGIVALVSSMIDKMKEFITECDKAKKKYEDFIKSTQVSTGSAEITAQIESMAVAAMDAQKASGNLMFTYEDYANAMVPLSKMYPELMKDTDAMSKLADTYLRFAVAMDTDVAGSITDTAKLFAKWDIAIGEQEDYLNTLYQLYAKTNVPIADMISLLGDGDRAFQLMGYSAEEAAGYIAAVYAQKKDLSDLSTLISGIERLQNTQYGTFGSDVQQSEFIQKVMIETEGMIDETAILNKIDDIYRGMFPTIEMDAETQSEVNTNMQEMAKTLAGMAKLADIKPEDISDIMESSKGLDSLSDIKADSTQIRETLDSMWELQKKQYDVASTQLETAFEVAKLSAVQSGDYLGYFNSDEEYAVEYWKQKAATYKNWYDYQLDNPILTTHYKFTDETEWQKNKDKYTTNVIISAKASDLIDVNTESNLNAIASTNNPARV